MTAPTVPRREQLLEAAAALFAERGYHAVGIDDIGAAAGISGPGVYRHFPGKQALLAALCERALTRMLDGAQGISAAHGDPRASLEALVELHVAFAVDERALIGVWGRELPALSDDLAPVAAAPDAGVRAALAGGPRAACATTSSRPRSLS